MNDMKGIAKLLNQIGKSFTKNNVNEVFTKENEDKIEKIENC